MPRSVQLTDEQLDTLRKLMRKKDFTNQKLADEAGCDVRTITRLFQVKQAAESTLSGGYKKIWKWEGNEKVPQKIETIGICPALGITLGALLHPLPDIPDAEADRVIDGERAPGNVVVRPSTKTGEPRTASHVVIAAFWQDKSAKKLRIHPKLCYRHPEHPDKIIKEPSPKEEYVRGLEEFPDFLGELMRDVEPCLASIYESVREPPETSGIRLFVPVELLSLPWHKWLGEVISELHDYPFAIGCSERFDPSDRTRSAKLHKALKQGWERFRQQVPDENLNPLCQLQWLYSDRANGVDLTTYAGFRCPGDWLRQEESHLEKWMAVVESGIPLAMWGWEWQRATPSERAGDYLISHNRFDFFRCIPQLYREGREMSREHFGILFEDLDYLPDFPKPESQFFALPGT